MRLWPRGWHAETWVCSLRGHHAPAAFATELPAGDERLGMDLAGGRRLARCLRCDVWVERPIPSAEDARWVVLPPVEEVPKPRRGKPLDDAILIRLIAVERGIHSALFALVAVALLLVETNLSAVRRFAHSVESSLSSSVRQTGPGSGKSWLDRRLTSVFDLRQDTVKVLLITAVVYAVIEGVEAVGLWRERRWAEYLTVVATAGFLPFEVHEVVRRVTALRVGALVVNVAVVAWLVWSKHLFGVRGGHATLGARTDWKAVMDNPTPADVAK